MMGGTGKHIFAHIDRWRPRLEPKSTATFDAIHWTTWVDTSRAKIEQLLRVPSGICTTGPSFAVDQLSALPGWER